VGITVGSRELPGKRPVTRDINNNDDNNNNNNNNNNYTPLLQDLIQNFPQFLL
jgi:hypothetical protein